MDCFFGKQLSWFFSSIQVINSWQRNSTVIFIRNKHSFWKAQTVLLSLVKPLRVGIIWTYAKSLDNKRVYYSVVKYFITNKKVFLSVC